MPELPEVEIVAAGVNARTAGEVIESVWVSEKSEPFKTPAAGMQALVGLRFLHVHRVGKHIVCDLGSGGVASQATFPRGVPELSQIPLAGQWIVHLGMTGRLLVCEADAPTSAHTHAVLGLRSGRELRFVDPRRFGRLALHLFAGETEAGFRGTGQEPLTISSEAFAALFHRRKTPIKAALLNQKLLQGVGNIYADESLFRAGIRPRRSSGRLTRAELARLRSSLATVLLAAIAQGGSSVSDYVNAEGERGFFQLDHCVYLRTGQPCRVCGTLISRILIGGRGTHYCPLCQR